MAVSLLGQTTKCLGNTYLQRTSLLFNTIESRDIISAGNFSMNLKIRNHHACSIVLQEETLWDDVNRAKTGFSWSPNQLSRRLGVAWLPCLSCLLVCLVLLALLVLLASLLSLASCLAALWRQLCNAFDKIPTQWHQQHGQAFCQQDFVHFWNMTVEREKNWFAFDIALQIRANIKQNTGFLVTERWVTIVSMVCSFLRG